MNMEIQTEGESSQRHDCAQSQTTNHFVRREHQVSRVELEERSGVEQEEAAQRGLSVCKGAFSSSSHNRNP